MAPLTPRADASSKVESVKLLLIGDSGAGKTGSLASLPAAGYKLRLIDLDNGSDILRNYLLHPKSPYITKAGPDVASRVSIITLTDPMRSVGGKLVPKQVTVWQRAMEVLGHWKDADEDLGPLSSWGPDTVLAIDSLSFLATAAFNFTLMMNGQLGKNITQNEWRRAVGSAQNLLREFLSLIFDSSIKCHVILTSHITMISELGDNPTALESSERKTVTINGYPSAIGRALSPHIPRWFNSTLIARPIGYGSAVQHKIYTTTQNVGGQLINAKNPAPFTVKQEYPLASGLADYFSEMISIQPQTKE